jgi:hypothetical protein
VPDVLLITGQRERERYAACESDRGVVASALITCSMTFDIVFFTSTSCTGYSVIVYVLYSICNKDYYNVIVTLLP